MSATHHDRGQWATREKLNELSIQYQFADFVRRESWPDLGSKAKSGKHVEHSLAEDVDEQQAGHGQELGSPGRAKLERDPDSECSGSPAVDGYRHNNRGTERALIEPARMPMIVKKIINPINCALVAWHRLSWQRRSRGWSNRWPSG